MRGNSGAHRRLCHDMDTEKANNTEKRVFTTGEAAKVCGVSQQTIIRSFDAGRLTGFKVPGSKFRRIPRDELVRFMRANGMPLEALGEDGSVARVLLISADQAVSRLVESTLKDDRRFSLVTANNAFDAGLLTESFKPGLVILSTRHDEIDPVAICRRLRSRSESADVRILSLGGASDSSRPESLRRAGANEVLIVPCAGDLLLRRLVSLLASASER